MFVERSRRLGMPLDDLMEHGAVAVVPVNPMTLYPDGFPAHVENKSNKQGGRLSPWTVCAVITWRWNNSAC